MFVNIANKLLAAFQMRGPKHERTSAPHGVMSVAPSQPYVLHGVDKDGRPRKATKDGKPFGVNRVPLLAVQIIPRSRYTPKNCRNTLANQRRAKQAKAESLTKANGFVGFASV